MPFHPKLLVFLVLLFCIPQLKAGDAKLEASFVEEFVQFANLVDLVRVEAEYREFFKTHPKQRTEFLQAFHFALVDYSPDNKAESLFVIKLCFDGQPLYELYPETLTFVIENVPISELAMLYSTHKNLIEKDPHVRTKFIEYFLRRASDGKYKNPLELENRVAVLKRWPEVAKLSPEIEKALLAESMSLNAISSIADLPFVQNAMKSNRELRAVFLRTVIHAIQRAGTTGEFEDLFYFAINKSVQVENLFPSVNIEKALSAAFRESIYVSARSANEGFLFGIQALLQSLSYEPAFLLERFPDVLRAVAETANVMSVRYLFINGIFAQYSDRPSMRQFFFNLYIRATDTDRDFIAELSDHYIPEGLLQYTQRNFAHLGENGIGRNCFLILSHKIIEKTVSL